jgi:two-component system response regulator YesN
MIDWPSHGFQIVGTASDGAEALELINRVKPDLVITDIRMPEMDGLELIRAMTSAGGPVPADSQQAGAPVAEAAAVPRGGTAGPPGGNALHSVPRFVIVSGYRDFDYARTAIHLGVEDYLLKPIYEENLCDTLETVAAKLAAQTPQSARPGEPTGPGGITGQEAFAALAGDEPVPPAVSQFLSQPYHLIVGRIDDFRLLQAEDPSGAAQVSERLTRFTARILKVETEGGYTHHCDGYSVSLLSSASIHRQYGDCGRYVERIHSYVGAGGRAASFFTTSDLVGLEPARMWCARIPRLLDLLRLREPGTIAQAEILWNTGAAEDAGSLSSDQDLMHSIADGDERSIRATVAAARESALSLPLEPSLLTDYARKLCFEMHRLVTDLSGNPSNIDALNKLCRNDLRDACVVTIFDLVADAALETAVYLQSVARIRPSARMQRIRDDLMQSYTADVTLRDLAARHGISPAYLGQLFRKEYGESFKDYRNRLRVEEAARFLRTTDLRVYEVAQRVGYQSTDYFERRFQAFYGTTPTAYRSRFVDGGDRRE